MPVESTSRNRELTAVLVTSAVLLGVYGLWQNTVVQDWWKGRAYDESVSVSEIRESLALTSTGERIFLATQPSLEEAVDFNEHCNSHQAEVSLLGCYTNDKIYIYDVREESLQDSNKVTAAHELLHAAWKRLGGAEREEVSKLLRLVQRDKSDWAEEELSLYDESEQLEELYTRIGTKLREIPEKLEKHYAKYFTDRAKIVKYYEHYQAPFSELKEKNEAIREQILQLNSEIEQGRTSYNSQLAELDRRIKSFNQCAETEGCFTSKDIFAQQRRTLESEKAVLDSLRDELNGKIDQSNTLLAEYQKNQEMLGELSNALNSNQERIHE